MSSTQAPSKTLHQLCALQVFRVLTLSLRYICLEMLFLWFGNESDEKFENRQHLTPFVKSDREM